MTIQFTIEDRRSMTPRTLVNDFGEIATRQPVVNNSELVAEAVTLCDTKGAGDAMDKRRIVALVRAGKFSDEKLSELIAFWQTIA